MYHVKGCSPFAGETVEQDYGLDDHWINLNLKPILIIINDHKTAIILLLNGYLPDFISCQHELTVRSRRPRVEHFFTKSYENLTLVKVNVS